MNERKNFYFLSIKSKQQLTTFPVVDRLEVSSALLLSFLGEQLLSDLSLNVRGEPVWLADWYHSLREYKYCCSIYVNLYFMGW